MRSTRNKGCTKYEPSRRRLLRFIFRASSFSALSPEFPLSPVIITLVTVDEVELSEVVILRFSWICLKISSYWEVTPEVSWDAPDPEKCANPVVLEL